MTSRVAADAVTVPPPSPEPAEIASAPGDRLPSRFRSGRWFLLAEGIPVAALAGGALAAHGLLAARGSAGLTFLWLTLTPLRSGLLLAFGILAVLATLRRRATMIVTAAAVTIALALTAMGDAALAAGVPHQWGVDPHNAGLYVVLVVYNFALLIWLFPDLWERRDGTRRDRNALQER